MTDDLSRYYKAYQKGIEDAKTGTSALELCLDTKEHDSYVRGYETIIKKEINTKVIVVSARGHSDYAEESEPSSAIL